MLMKNSRFGVLFVIWRYSTTQSLMPLRLLCRAIMSKKGRQVNDDEENEKRMLRIMIQCQRILLSWQKKVEEKWIEIISVPLRLVTRQKTMEMSLTIESCRLAAAIVDSKTLTTISPCPLIAGFYRAVKNIMP